MEVFPTKSLFDQFSETQIKDILTQPLLFSSVFIEKTHQNLKNEEQKVNIEVRGDFILQTSQENQMIISGFEPNYDAYFQIIYPQNKENRQLEKPIAVRLSFKDRPDKTVVLFNQDAVTIEEFCRTLTKKSMMKLNLRNFYAPIKNIGKGATAKVYQVKKIQNGQIMAVKGFTKKQLEVDHKKALINQVQILKSLNHPNICSFDCLFESDNSIYIVFQFLPVSLSDIVSKQRIIHQANIRKMMKQLLQAASYMHSKGIMHRDLSVNNIMFRKTQEQKLQAVIVDFGLAQKTINPQFLFKKCGTPGFIAPQIFQYGQPGRQIYSQKCDVFSLAVVFYIMIQRKLLFSGASAAEIINNNKQLNYSEHAFDRLSPEARDLLQKMLEKDVTKRLSAQQALNHNFIQQRQIPMRLNHQNIVEQATAQNIQHV